MSTSHAHRQAVRLGHDAEDADAAAPSSAEMLAYYRDTDEEASPPRQAVPTTFRTPRQVPPSLRHTPRSTVPSPSASFAGPRLSPSTGNRRPDMHMADLGPARPLQQQPAAAATPMASRVATAGTPYRPNDTGMGSAHAAPTAHPAEATDFIPTDHGEYIRQLEEAVQNEQQLNDDLLSRMEEMKGELDRARSSAANANSDEVGHLERLVDDERRQHSIEMSRLAEAHANALAKEAQAQREIDMELRQKQVEIAALRTSLEIALAKVESLTQALEQERQASAGLAAHYRTVLHSVVTTPIMHQSRVETAHHTVRTPPRGASSDNVAGLLGGGAGPRASPPRAPVQMTAGVDMPARRIVTPPRNVSNSSPTRVAGREVPASGVPAPTAVIARPVIRDKNEPSKPSGYDAAEVETLEAELMELCAEREAIDEQLRRVENVRTKSIAEKARKDTLARRLAELTAAVGSVRKRLRDLSALER